LHVPANTCLWQVPVLHDGAVRTLTACCGVDDNPKQDAESGTFLNVRFPRWLDARDVHAEEIWDVGQPRTLWTARLFPVGGGQGLAVAAWMMSADPSSIRDMAKVWRTLPRMSLAQLHASVDADTFVSVQQELVSDLVLKAVRRSADGGLDRNLAALGGQIENREVREWLSVLGSEMARGRRTRGLVAESRLLRMRADLAAVVGREAEACELRDAAFAAVQRQVSAAVSAKLPDAVSGLEPGTRVTVELPVRFDIAGGWSDTPPYCLERPARVLNLAALLDGQAPVGAYVETLSEPRWELALGSESDETLVVENGEPVAGTEGLRDRFALLRTALVLAGYGEGTTITQGVRVRTWANVPRGSGLGTSSILAAALVRALQRAAGRDDSSATVSDLVLVLEQRLTTGGGWQDQVGGLVPGIKLISSAPVVPIELKVEQVPLLPSVVEELEARLVIAFTGIERLAKNVLQIVVGRYLQRDGRLLSAIAELVALAEEGRRCFAMGQLDGVGEVMRRAWETHQVLDPHCSNSDVDDLLRQIDDLCSGVKLAGAGGGGFLGALARDADAAERVKLILAQQPGVHVYSWSLASGEEAGAS
jgi:fucokinase